LFIGANAYALSNQSAKPNNAKNAAERLNVKRPPQRAALIPELPAGYSVPAEAGVALRSTTLYIKAVTAQRLHHFNECRAIRNRGNLVYGYNRF
jgi:hypothetical protein